MPTPPRLYLIDGSSQMYRAYHAIRGLTGPDGKSTNAVYIFVTMLRKLLNDHKPEYIAASFDLAGPTFRDDLVDRLQGQPRADARRARRADSAGARGLRSARRADPHLEALRGRRCDRHAGDEGGGRRASRSRSSPATRTSFSSSATASASTTRATKARGTTPTASRRSSASRPEQVVDVLALMGDTIDNIKGVPGIGEKGARELIATYGIAREPARARRRGHEQALPRRPARPRRRRAAEPRAGAHPHRRAGRVRSRGAALPRRLARALLRALHELGFRTLVEGVRADRGDRRQGLPRRQHARGRRERWPTSCARPGAFALRVLPDGAVGDARGDRRPVVLDRAARRRDYVPIAAPRRSGSTATACDARGRARRAAARCSRTRRSGRSATT